MVLIFSCYKVSCAASLISALNALNGPKTQHRIETNKVIII